MASTSDTQVLRNDQHGWRTVIAGDNGFDLLEYEFKASSIVDAAEKSREIADIVTQHQYENSASTQITTRSWQVAIRISAPTGTWYSPAQEQLAADIEHLAMIWDNPSAPN